ncbi:proton channel OTOP1-like [Hyperolius riggenbachi]|uniref:proton channel OTOP1-like n=1 Tax=Hyperolius riggenbachi TaxID=752182 RepID=UPI0035A300EC
MTSKQKHLECGILAVTVWRLSMIHFRHIYCQDVSHLNCSNLTEEEEIMTRETNNATVISNGGHQSKAAAVPSRHASSSPNALYSSLSISSLEDEQETWDGGDYPRTTTHLSLLYLALLTFFGSAVLLAEMHYHNPQTHNVHGFLTILMLTSSAWMLWFGWTAAKNKKVKMYQDHQAGASWLKGGLCLFALATLVLDCLTLGYYHELHHCTSIVVTSFPVVQAVFTVFQVSLLTFYAKVCIQEKQCLNRFGLMHTLATNILMWMSVVLDESMKQLEEIYNIKQKKLNLLECLDPLCLWYSSTLGEPD